MLTIASCRQFAERLPDYADGGASADERGALQAHQRSCPRCAELERQYRGVQTLLRNAIGPQALRPNFNETTGKRLKEIAVHPAPLSPDHERLLPPVPSFTESLQRRLGAAPWWAISGAFHALLLLLLTLVGMALLQVREDQLVFTTDLMKQKDPPEPDPTRVRDIFRQPLPVEAVTDVVTEQPIVVHEEVEVADHVETANESDLNSARGEDGLADALLGGTGSVAALGLGGGGGGAFGQRTGGGRRKLALRGGGGVATESAVDAALAWLARHQEADGHWDYKKYGGGGKVWDDGSEEGISALALLAFLGAGHTEKIGKHRDNVKRAVQWILSRQREDGGWGGPKNRNGQEYEKYDVALCTLALCEAYAMGRNPTVGKAAQKGVDWIVGDQDYDDGTWQHGPHKSTSLIGWNVMALKSAKVAGLGTDPACFEKAIAALERVTEKPGAVARMADETYQDGKQLGRVRYSPDAAHYAHKGETMTAVGMVCFQFMGRGDETRYQAELTSQFLPAWPPTANLGGAPQTSYHWYYATLGLFQHGGETWKRWNEALKAALVPSQRKGGPLDGSLQDLDGSWDPDDVWCKVGGRVYQTAMCALCLEVYYRYLPLYR
ncbi:MAG: zf-HC2 domain-containing protein [Planctomycetota bacterium]|nr:zf-HC2 domain-containing protein [Planctomycetota bacterium]